MRFRHRWILPALSLLAGWATPVPALADRALIITIGAYHADPRIRPLAGPAEDARLMQRLAVERLGYAPSDIKLLQDDAASRDGILQALNEWLVKATQPGERVLIHYSGHGAQIPDTSGDEQDQLDEVLVPADTALNAQTGKFDNLILDDELEAVLAQLNDRRVTLIVDACHSGTVTRAVLGDASNDAVRTPLALSALSKLPARGLGVVKVHREEPGLVPAGGNLTVWTAVSPMQEALDDIEVTPRSGHFTNRLVKALTSRDADANHDGQLAHAELFDWLRAEGEAYCQRNQRICRSGLLPTLEITPALLTQSVDTTLLGRPTAPQPLTVTTEIALTPPPVAPGPAQKPLIARVEVLRQQQVCQPPTCVLKQNEAVRFRVKSDFKGYLTLLHIDPAGQLIQLFPNSRSVARNPNGLIRANQPLTIPDAYYGFEFTVAPPLGRGRVVALVTEDAVDLADIVQAKRGLSVVASEREAVDYLARLAERLRKPWTGDTLNRRARWAVGVADYESRTD